MTLIIALIDGDSDRKAFIGFIVDDVTDDDREFRRVRRAVDTLGDVIDRYGDAGRDIILKLTNIKTNVKSWNEILFWLWRCSFSK